MKQFTPSLYPEKKSVEWNLPNNVNSIHTVPNSGVVPIPDSLPSPESDSVSTSVSNSVGNIPTKSDSVKKMPAPESNSVTDNKYHYYAMFARSDDKGSISFDKTKPNLHLISSVYASDKDIEFSMFYKTFPYHAMNLSDNGQLIIVFIENSFVKTNYKNEPVSVKINDHIIKYHVDITYYFTCLYFDLCRPELNYITLTRDIFGVIQEKDEDFKSHLGHTLFVWNCPGISWSTIVWLHAQFGVQISGGNSSRRNILSTVHYRLSCLLFLNGVRASSVYNSFSTFKSINKNLPDSALINIKNNIENELSNNLVLIILKAYAGASIDYLNFLLSNKYNQIEVSKKAIKYSKYQLDELDENDSCSKYSEKATKKHNATIEESNKNIETNLTATRKLLEDRYKFETFIKDSRPSTEFIDEINNLIKVYKQDRDLYLIDPLIRKVKDRSQLSKFKKEKKNSIFNNNWFFKKQFSTYSSSFLRQGLHQNTSNLLNKANNNHRFIYTLSESFLSKKRKNSYLPASSIRIRIRNPIPIPIRFYSTNRINRTNRTNRFNFIQDSLIYTDLMKILNSDLTLKDKQLSIEEYFYNINKNNYLISSKGKSLDYSLMSGDIIKILKSTEPDLTKLINNFIDRYSIMETENKNLNLCTEVYKTVGIDYLIQICFGRVLKILSNRNNIKAITSTNIIEDLSRDIINQYNLILYKNWLISEGKININTKLINLPYGYKTWKESNKILILEYNNHPELLFHLGSELINILTIVNLIKSRIFSLSYDEKKRILMIGAKFNSIKFDKLNFLDFSKHLPMLVTPNKYKLINSEIEEGGYLLNNKAFDDPLITKKNILVYQSTIAEKNMIINMVNNLNSVEYKINSEVLEFIFKNYKKYNLIIDPEEESPYKDKSDLKLNEKKEMLSFYSKKTLEQNILGLANLLVDGGVEKFYLPVKLDYRGRVYCTSDLINYQGTVLSKSLLLFANESKVYVNNENAIYFLKIFGANCFGNKIDKDSYNNRANWVNENETDIIDFENGNLINKANKKLLFIAFCFEYRKYIKALKNKEEYFYSNLPIQLDASCNGYQHLSLLTRDKVLADLVNLKEANPSDIPDDFYTFISFQFKDYFLDKIKELSSQEKKSDKEKVILASCERLAKLNLTGNRKLIKTSIMCIPYNVSKFSMCEYIKEELTPIDKDNFMIDNDPNKKLTRKEIETIADAIFAIIYKYFPKLISLTRYFKQVSKISNNLNIPIPWTLPTGLRINQQFFNTTQIFIKPFSYEKDTLKIEILNPKKFNTRKQTQALMPNLIHSLDAASLNLVIESFFKEASTNSFFSIHDCFAVSCDKVELLTGLLKHAYVKLYLEESYLKKFDLEFKDKLKLTLGENYEVKTYLKGKKKGNEYIEVIDSKGNILKLEYPKVDYILEPVNGIIDIRKSSFLIS
jgi:hypothetical protein